VLPLFAFTSAGFALSDLSLRALGQPVTLGVILGLVLGKPLGVFGMAWLGVRLNWARAPSGATSGELFGVSLLCGIGFTMSLFIGALAFPADAALQTDVRLGVIGGSLLSLALGSGVLQLCAAARARRDHVLAAT
jgi:NhaA family Na+:H+ antiporter